jgi:hypothetical protein
MFKKARDEGYTQVLWVDASFWAVKPLDMVFERIEQDGYLFQFDGWFVGQWSNATCREYFGLSQQEADKLFMFHGGFMGLDFSSSVACAFFAQWEAACEAGAFKGSWEDHRHDMTCGSVVANRLGMKQEEDVRFFAYCSGEVTCPDETLTFMCAGM